MARGRGLHRRAFPPFPKAAALGSHEATSNLAFLHLRGVLGEADVPRGLTLLEGAVEAGSQSAAWALHNIYREGRYLPADPARAAYWLERVAEMGSTVAVCRLVEGLREGRAGIPAPERVAELVARAARAGAPDAAAAWGLLLYEGVHVPRDESTAWAGSSAPPRAAMPSPRPGSAMSCTKGKGVLADPAAATQWYERAAAQGHAGARVALTALRLEGEASPEELARVF